MRLVRRVFRFFFSLLRGAVWAVGLLTLIVLGLLAIAERPLPRETLDRLLDKLSTNDDCLDARSAAFGLRGGLVLRNIRLLPKRVAGPPWITADELRVSGSLTPSRPPREWLDTILAHKVNVASLPAGLPVLSVTATNPSARPLIQAPIHFDLVDAGFLGLHFKRLQGWLRQENGVLIVDDARIEWPAANWTEEATGHVRFDPATGHVEGLVSGRTVPDKIFPLLRLLHASDVEDICRRFTFPSGPLDVETRFLVAPERHHSELRVTVSCADCTYNGVPVLHANAVIEAEGSNGLDHVTIRPLACERSDGSLSGGLVFDCNRNTLDVLAQSEMPLDPLLRIIGLTNAVGRTGVTFEAPPRLTVAGRVAMTSSRESSSLTGTLTANGCSVHGVSARDVRADFVIATNVYQLRQVQAVVAGGTLLGEISFQAPPGTTQIAYTTSFQLRDLDIENLSATMGFTNPPPGRVNATVELQSHFDAARRPTLDGQGELKLTNGVISRIPLFAGFTDYLARNVPGVETIVNESEARLPFTISNNVLRSDGVLIEGNVFSLSGKGVYRIPEDQLDFAVQASIFKRRTWLGKITRLVTFPFAKLLLEFHVHGPIGHPAWEYRGILERITDSMSDGASGNKETLP